MENNILKNDKERKKRMDKIYIIEGDGFVAFDVKSKKDLLATSSEEIATRMCRILSDFVIKVCIPKIKEKIRMGKVNIDMRDYTFDEAFKHIPDSKDILKNVCASILNPKQFDYLIEELIVKQIHCEPNGFYIKELPII